MKRVLIAMGVSGGLFLLLRKSRSQELDGLGDARHQLYSMPKKWWIPDSSKLLRNCYQTKAEALMRFAHYNARVIDNYNGISHNESPAEFDAINQKYGLSGTSAAVVNIAQALWVAMPAGRPYCLTDIDLEALNGTSPAREDPLGVGFLIPDFAEADKQNKEQAELWKNQERVVAPKMKRQSKQDEVPF